MISERLYSRRLLVTSAKNKIVTRPVIRNSILKLHPVRSKQPSKILLYCSSDTHTREKGGTKKDEGREREEA